MFKSSPLLHPGFCLPFATKLLGMQTCQLPGVMVSPRSPLATSLPAPLASLLPLELHFLLTS